MKLNVLIFHQRLPISGPVLNKYRAYITEPHVVHTLDEVLSRLQTHQYSLIVVEVTPPWKFAAEPLVIIRSATNTPILALLRGHDIDDFRRCRETANDCIWEPFTPEEIIARGTAIVEHSVFNDIPSPSIKHIFCRGLLIVPKYRRVYVNENEVNLSRKEYNILLFMAWHREQVLSKEQIYDYVWNGDYAENVDGVVSYQIHNIRKKLARYANEGYIENVWGEGYRFCERWEGAAQECV